MTNDKRGAKVAAVTAPPPSAAPIEHEPSEKC
jgi:hypothetical protein